MSTAAETIAHRWLDAFNRHDLPALLALYAEGCTHTSPKLRALHPETGGKLHGKLPLTGWWEAAFKRLPGLRYELVTVTATDARVIIEYVRHVPNEPATPVAEAFDLHEGRIVASRVYHG